MFQLVETDTPRGGLELVPELVEGVEPTITRLQITCLTIRPHQHIKSYSKTAEEPHFKDLYCLFVPSVIVALITMVAMLSMTRLGWEPRPAFTLVYTRFRRRPGVFFVSSICLSVGTNPHLPTAVCRVAFYWWPPHRSPTVTPHSLFFGLLIFD